MSDETAAGSSRASDRSGSPGGNPGEQSPLQARAQLLKNWSWELVIRLNRGACERGRAQHGFNREAHGKVAAEWEEKRQESLSLAELLDFLRHCHRAAPFLFFNGNTFADVSRQVSQAAFAEFALSRRREAVSAIAHFVAGVLDRDAMISIIESLAEVASFKPGDRVKTFRGTSHGVITAILPDGRVTWKSDGSSAELIALPESLIRES
jgi:hypothetical protein